MIVLSSNIITLDEVIKKLESLQPVSCPLYHMDYPCVICLQCPRANYHEYYIENYGFMRWTTNSVILSFRLPLRDELDKILLDVLIKELTSKLRFLMQKPEAGYHISIFVKHSDMSDPMLSSQIKTFLTKDLGELMGYITMGKTQIKEWASKIIHRLSSVTTRYE